MQAQQQARRRSFIRRKWLAHLWREWAMERRRPIAPAFAKPEPRQWRDDALTAAWIGHSTVLINFYGLWLITDPVLFQRIGIRLPFITVGPKRLTAPALTFAELPRIDLVLVSHAHFDHLDLRTLMMFDSSVRAITARHTDDLFRGTRFAEVTELSWGESVQLRPRGLEIEVRAFRVQHWGARMRHDEHRCYNGYIIARGNRRIIYSGDTAITNAFGQLRDGKPYDLAIMSIGAYDPWIRSHATPEQAIAMADAAGARFIMPVHHQTFRLSAEPFREPIERFTRALGQQPERMALCEIGETFVLPD
jgi:L-ascorbate metabolism protein UlaG (beta-lactamase superfamily)